jgi:hypothetical protein
MCASVRVQTGADAHRGTHSRDAYVGARASESVHRLLYAIAYGSQEVITYSLQAYYLQFTSTVYRYSLQEQLTGTVYSTAYRNSLQAQFTGTIYKHSLQEQFTVMPKLLRENCSERVVEITYSRGEI